MKRCRYILLLLWAAGGFVSLAAQSGNTCSSAIPIGRNYEADITQAKTVWYKANTFDLPLEVTFTPNDPTTNAPEIEMDFSCTPGHYTDSIICSIFCISDQAYIVMPYVATPQVDYDSQGHKIYYVAMGEFYRNMLLNAGISYNVEVYIKVTFYGPGHLAVVPDNTFANCMDNGKYLHLGDTVHVSANDTDRYLIAPYTRWQYDSIQYTWEGTQPLQISVGKVCTFDPCDNSNTDLVDLFYIQPGGIYKLSNALINQYITSSELKADGGVFYVKALSNSSGILKVQSIPLPPPAEGTIVLKYDKATSIRANDTLSLYAIPNTWTDAVEFYTPTDHVFKMYVGYTADFTPSTAVDSFRYSVAPEGGHILQWMEEKLQNQLSRITGKYLYIRFACSAATTITPRKWTPSDCVTKSIDLPVGTRFTIKARSTDQYRIFYNDWRGGDMKLEWKSSASTCPVYILDTCDIDPTNANGHDLFTRTLNRNQTWTIPAATVDGWSDKVDDEGYLYIRFIPSSRGPMIVSTNAPEEVDPFEPPTATIAVSCVGEADTETGAQTIAVTVSAEQDLVLKQGTTPVSNWHQLPTDAAHNEILAPGTYTLSGADEEVTIVMQ